MKISRISIRNYRNIKETSFALSGTTIFMGENNSGKSNMLRAIALPLYSEDNMVSKNLSWEDINLDAKNEFFSYLSNQRSAIVSGTVSKEELLSHIPVVSVELHFTANESELYYVKDIAFDISDGVITYGLLYRFCIDSVDKLLENIKSILSDESVEIERVKRNLLPISLYSHSIIVPGKQSKVSYDTLKQFRYTLLPAERDGFSYDSNRIGYRSLVKLLEAKYSNTDMVKIEGEYETFFNTVKKIGNIEQVINWQDESDIPYAKEFIKNISVLPNMPSLSSILNSIKLGYSNESLSLQGLGYRNLILLLVLLNSWEKHQSDIALNVLIMEEPEAHLCVNNIRLMYSFINALTKDNAYIQLIFTSHSTEFINKHDLKNLVVLDSGYAYALMTELGQEERDYLSKNPNTDIYKLFLSHRCILVEGISEELLIKAFLRSQNKLDNIDVLSFHKGFTKIMDIWLKTNRSRRKKLGIIRDYDNQDNARELHHQYNAIPSICVATTSQRTLEPEIVNTSNNYELLKSTYGEHFGWSKLSKEELSEVWEGQNANVMLTIARDLSEGKLRSFSMPAHIEAVLDFMAEKKDEN